LNGCPTAPVRFVREFLVTSRATVFLSRPMRFAIFENETPRFKSSSIVFLSFNDRCL
jgi:hypothetical protein